MTRRPPKPRIVKRHLYWKYQYGGVWNPYFITTYSENGRRRQRSIKLKWGGDAQELDRLYWLCMSGRHDRQVGNGEYTWGNLIIRWRKDPRAQMAIKDSTRRDYRPHLSDIETKNAKKDVRHTTRAAVRRIHEALAETPRKADKRIAVIKLLWNYARNELDWPLGENPAQRIKPYGPQKPFEPWPEWMLRKINEAPPIVQTAATLIIWTGQRPNAAITMKWDAFDGERVTVLDEKRDENILTYCPQALRDHLSSVPKKGAYILAKSLAEPLGYDAVEKAFRAWRESLGKEAKPFTLHGLRKVAIIALAETGATDAQIQAVTGQSAQMVAYYRTKASRLEMSRLAQQGRERNENETRLFD